VRVQQLLVLFRQLAGVTDLRCRQDLVAREPHADLVRLLLGVTCRHEGASVAEVHQDPLGQAGVGVREDAVTATQRRAVPVDDLSTLPALGLCAIR
jgi:hypothetical protein